MDVQGLRVLRELARLGSISAAADALGYTQSAVSRQLATLERSVGHPLAERTRRGAHLTPAGEIVLGHGDVVLAELDGAREQLARLAPEASADLRLAAFPSAVASFVPEAVIAVADRLQVCLSITAGQATEEAVVREGRADVCLASPPEGAAAPADLRVVPVREDPLWCCLPAGHPLAERERVPLSMLADDPWVVTAMTLCADRGLVMDACRRNGFCPRAVSGCDDYATTQGLVAAGVGVAMLPQMALGALHPGVVVRLPAVPVVRRVVALVPRSGTAIPGTDALLEALRDAAAAIPEPGGRPAATPAGLLAGA